MLIWDYKMGIINKEIINLMLITESTILYIPYYTVHYNIKPVFFKSFLIFMVQYKYRAGSLKSMSVKQQ